MPEIEVMDMRLIRDAELLAVHVELVSIDDGPEGALGQWKFAGEHAGLQSWRVRFPVRADEIRGKCVFDTRKSQHGFGVVGRHRIPEAPEIFECGVAFPIEEGVLQTIGFVAREAVRHVDHMARFEPPRLADHGREGIRHVFPGDPVVPAKRAPGERFVANLELRFEGEAMSSGDGGSAKIGGNAFQRVEVDAVGANFFQKLRERFRGRSGLFVRSGIPGEHREKNSDVATMKIRDKFFQRGQAARKIAQKIELIAIIQPDVGVDVPEQNSINRAEAAFGFREEFFGRVLASFRVVDRAVPHKKLDLGEDALGPCKTRICVVGFVHAQLRPALLAPRLHARQPCWVGRIGRTGEEYLGGRGRNGKSHCAVGCDQGVAGFPFVGVERCRAGEKQNGEEWDRPVTGRTWTQAHKKKEYANGGRNSARVRGEAG